THRHLLRSKFDAHITHKSANEAELNAGQWSAGLMHCTTRSKRSEVNDGNSVVDNSVYTCVIPPSAGKSTPVMKLLSSEARNKMADAISSARPTRPRTVICAYCVFIASTSSFVPTWASIIGVSIGPGLSVLTRIPRSLKSAAQLLTKD